MAIGLAVGRFFVAEAQLAGDQLQVHEQILHVHQADDVIQIAFAQRHARVVAVLDGLEHLADRLADHEIIDLRARGHDLADLQVAELEGAGENALLALWESRRCSIDSSSSDAQLVGGVRHAGVFLAADLHRRPSAARPSSRQLSSQMNG